MAEAPEGRDLKKEQIRSENRSKGKKTLEKTEEYLRSHFPNLVLRTKIIGFWPQL